jgi:hypothetical protein
MLQHSNILLHRFMPTLCILISIACQTPSDTFASQGFRRFFFFFLFFFFNPFVHQIATKNDLLVAVNIVNNQITN